MAKAIKMKARPLMLQGTSSHVGKSVLTAAFCRVFSSMGFSVAPFKAQNMALNSYVTADGAEIGRAQAFQAEAAGISPSADMNPVLLKPTADSVCQVIIQGKVHGAMSARQYHGFKKEAASYVMESYGRLARKYDIIVIEGAGSPAEVNLRDNDIANMGVARMCNSPVVLVGDIDRGGVFASIVGTMELLEEDERSMVRGFIINKFRGDMGLLSPGLEFLEAKAKRPVLGVVPYMKGLSLPDEDGVALEERKKDTEQGGLRIAVLKLPRISNFTDFDPLRLEGVRLDFIEDPKDICSPYPAGMVIIPGTKNTISDLNWLKERGFGEALERFRKNGGVVFGICGGLQMLGASVEDPHGVESEVKSAKGFGLLDIKTVLARNKNTFQVSSIADWPQGLEVTGYEIHMGESFGAARPFSRINKRNDGAVNIPEGAISQDGTVAGTYIHGIFDNDPFRGAVIKMLKGKDLSSPVSYRQAKEDSISALARTVKESVRLEELFNIMGLEGARG